MDRLRSLHYFVAAAKARSFSGAGRKLEVTGAAVSKLIGTLERELGATLFERHAQGLSLTATGASYLESCGPALAMLENADAQVTAGSRSPRGVVVVGVQPCTMQECVTAVLPRFNALYPEVQIDLRFVLKPNDPAAAGVDVFVLLGWPQNVGDLVQRRIGAASFVVCAAPSYWARYGMPRHPGELEQHSCLTIRGTTGTLMDLWQFRRGEERVAVAARGWLIVDNAHRDAVRDVAIAGGGVARLLDWHERQGHELASGALVAALTDWECIEVTPVNLLYPPSVRRIPRVRAFIDFVTQLFQDIERQRETPALPSARPPWMHAGRQRASATLARGR